VSSSGPGDGDVLPEPPADINRRRVPLVRRVAGSRYVRIHRAADGPVWFGRDSVTGVFRPPINRFDAPDRSYGVLYAALARDGAFAEAIGRKPRSFRSDTELAELAITTLFLARNLRLVDLHGGEAVGAIGATGVVGVGPHSLARRWSKALHEHPDRPDGIEYRCRHNSDELAVALYHRVGDDALTPAGTVSLVADAGWLAAMRRRHQIWEPPS
jgi:RES domain